jgi:hypothetical protein
MELARLIDQMQKGTVSEKTASVGNEKTPDESLKQALGQSLDTATKTAEKTASANDPVSDLMKIAGQLAGSDMAQEVEQARMCGSAFAEAAINKLAAYEAALQQVALENQTAEAKTAAEYGYQAASGVLAQRNQRAELEKAAAAGNPQAYAMLQKIAAEEYTAGQNTALEEVCKLASAEFIKGAKEVDVLLSRLSQ